MNFRDLEYIIAVTKEKSFHKASEVCHVSQPALSMQIKKVEEALDIKMFERSKKNIIVTDIGIKIVNEAKKNLFIKNQISELAKLHNQNITQIKLGIFPTIAQYILPSIIHNINKHKSEIQIYPIEEKSESLINLLNNGEIDFALLSELKSHQNLEYIPLFKDKFVLAIYPEHPLYKKNKISLADIDNDDLLLLEKGHCLRDHIEKLSDKAINSKYESTSLETIRQMVASKMGITIIPRVALNAEKSNDIIYLDFSDPVPYRIIYLATRKSYHNRNLAHTLAKVIKGSHLE